MMEPTMTNNFFLTDCMTHLWTTIPNDLRNETNHQNPNNQIYEWKCYMIPHIWFVQNNIGSMVGKIGTCLEVSALLCMKGDYSDQKGGKSPFPVSLYVFVTTTWRSINPPCTNVWKWNSAVLSLTKWELKGIVQLIQSLWLIRCFIYKHVSLDFL